MSETTASRFAMLRQADTRITAAIAYDYTVTFANVPWDNAAVFGELVSGAIRVANRAMRTYYSQRQINSMLRADSRFCSAYDL